MTERQSSYARVLYELAIPGEVISETVLILKENENLRMALKSPLVSLGKKEMIVERVFPAPVRRFLKTVCKNGRAGELAEIFAAYDEYAKQQEGILTATISCVTPPGTAQLQKIKTFLCSRYGKKDVAFQVKEDPSLLGGFILQAGGYEYDYSLKGRYKRLEENLIRR